MTTSGQRLISLASDTETRPTQSMREAIARAEVGDEQRGEDPTVNRLQERVAQLLGKEAALWLPGGTMCNIVAVKVHTRPADAIVADGMSHVIRAETGGAAFISGVMVEPIDTPRGIFTPEQLARALDRLKTAPELYAPQARLVCVEQTHNFGGGAVWSLAELGAVSKLARDKGLALHMDGARLMNACVASGVPASSFGALVDSVWIDFTKGLGAPIGAVLAGSRGFIADARRTKHVMGGAMRQAGIAAAGCLYALDHHVERLAQDHANAQRLAHALTQIAGITVRTPKPESNIVFFDASPTGVSNAAFLEALSARGIRMVQVRGEIRAVTHLDVSEKDVEAAIRAIEDVAATSRTSGRTAGARS
ncbi:MAG: low specificity L-threonine aldolase [Burkholderiaceae bacterium]|nr:low specificity L-threonine aldolase [Burkholderiaceae bacterium]